MLALSVVQCYTLHMITPKTKIVKVGREGWNGMYVVLHHGDRECQVKSITDGSMDMIYTAHLFVDAETFRYEKQWLIDRAASIGKKKA
jgi:hypothetical protein